MRKVAVVLAVLLLAAAVGLAVLPSSGGRFDPGRPDAGIGWLTGLLPGSPVRPDQVAGQPCWDAGGSLMVPAGGICTTRMPSEANRLTLCLADGVPALVRVRGDNYGPQTIPTDALGCDSGGRRIDLYDQQSVLTVVCAALNPCRLVLR